MTKVSRIALWILIVFTGLMTILHGSLLFTEAENSDQRLMFASFTAVNALSLVVLLIPVRRGEQWAWAASWIQVAATAAVVPIASGEEGLPYTYSAFAAVMAICLLLARPQSA